MADDINARLPAGNGEHIELNLQQRSVSVFSRQLPFLLIIVLVAGLGVHRIRSHDARLATIDTHLQNLYAQHDTHRGEMQALILSQFDQTRMQLRGQSELINSEGQQVRASLRENRDITGQRLQEQNELLSEQTKDVTKNQVAIIEHMRQQTIQLHQWFAVVIFKLENPEEHISLDFVMPHQQPR